MIFHCKTFQEVAEGTRGQIMHLVDASGTVLVDYAVFDSMDYMIFTSVRMSQGCAQRAGLRGRVTRVESVDEVLIDA